MPAGRPTKYTKKVGEKICLKVINGISLDKICSLKSMPSRSSVYKWVEKYPEFRDSYARAREESAHALADQLIDIGLTATAETAPSIRIHCDNLKWLASRFNRAYSQKQEVQVTGQIRHADMDIDQLRRRRAELEAQIEHQQSC